MGDLYVGNVDSLGVWMAAVGEGLWEDHDRTKKQVTHAAHVRRVMAHVT